MIEYSIVIPCFNEGGRITSTLTRVLGFMEGFSDSFEVIVVDDGSSDDTVEKVREYQKDHARVRLIENPHKGKGPTVWKGVMESKGSYIYFADADLSTPIDELKKLSNWLIDNDYDVVIASREGPGAERVEEPFYRHLMGRAFNFLVQLIALPGIKDSQCGFKLFRQEAAKNIFARLHIYGESAEERDKPYLGAFDVEILYIARKLGYRVKEVPVKWTHVKTERLNPLRDSINMAFDVIKVRLNDLKGVYKI